LGGIGGDESPYRVSLFREGMLPVPAERVGRLILVRTVATPSGGGGVVIYPRV
jgi:putative resolvase